MPSSDQALNSIRIYGLVWSKILAVDTYRFERNAEWAEYSLRSSKYRSATLGMIRFLLRELFRSRDVLSIDVFPESDKNLRYLFFKSLNRPDYNRFFDAVAQQVVSDGVTKVGIAASSAKTNWRALGFFLRHSPALLRLTRCWGSFKSLYFYTKVIRYICILQKIKAIRPEVAVVFADMHPLDNMVSQYFGKKGIPTATLQHGLYVDYGKEHTVNSLNYSNVVSAYFLAWGSNTAGIIERHNPRVKIEVCGKPTITNELVINRDAEFFTVLFDQKMYAVQNQQLLDIAAEVAAKRNLKVALKLHPTTPRKNYDFNPELEMPPETEWEKSRFCIGHSTSMIYEMLRRGMPVFKLVTDVPGHALPPQLSFDTFDDLMEKLDQNVDPGEIGRKFVKYIGSESLDHYSKTLKSL